MGREFPKRVVAALLLFWEPLTFAVRALQVLPTVVHRGIYTGLELVAHAGVAALCAFAGLALWNASPDALPLARAAVIVSTLRVIQSLYWSALPGNTVPGDEPLYAAIAVLVGAAALLALRRR